MTSSSPHSSETVSCRSFQSDYTRQDVKDPCQQGSFLSLCMNIGNHQQRRAASDTANATHSPHKEHHLGYQQCTAAFDNASLPTPPGTPQKEPLYSHNERQSLQVPERKIPLRQLSPLMVDTSDHLTSTASNDQPFQEADVSFRSGYGLGDHPALKSPGIFLPVDANIDARKREKLRQAIAQVLSQGAFTTDVACQQRLLTPPRLLILPPQGDDHHDDNNSQNSERPDVTSAQPFMLQGPGNFRFKRQISTESNDSGDIKFSSKSPVKRMQSVPSSKDAAVKASPHNKDSQTAKTTMQDSSKDEAIKCKPYATNVEWIVPNEEPKSEEDFYHISQMKRSSTYPSIVQTSNNSRRQSDMSMNTEKEMMVGFWNRRDTYGTGTTNSSRNQMVGEKGFCFPQTANVTNPIPFSPRIVSSTSHPLLTTTEPSSQRTRQFTKSNMERYGSLDSMNCEKHSSTNTSENSQYEKMFLNEFFRKRALRSNSDIPRSPSKQEIEEIREIIRKYHRTLSDPTFIPSQKKAMLYEERMIEDFANADEVFEEPSTSTPKYSDIRSCTTRSTSASYDVKEDIVRELLEHNQMMRKELVKRRLYQDRDEQRDTFKDPECHQDKDVPDMSRSAEIASLLIAELQRKGERKRPTPIPEDYHESYPDRVDGGSNKSGNRPNPDRYQDSDRILPPPRSPLPSTSMMSPPSAQRTPGESSRKRKRGEISLRMTCEDLAEKSKELTERLRELDHSPGKNCKCANIENEILLMANDAYSKIRRADDSMQALRQYQEEVNETNLTIFDSMSILCSIKTLCKHGRTLEDVHPGSVIFVLRCPTVSALDDLWRIYKSGQVEREFTEDFLNLRMRRKYNAYNVRIRVRIKIEDYLRVRKELDGADSMMTLDSSFSKSDTEIVRVGSASKENIHRRSPYKKASISNIAIVHMRSQSAPQVNQLSPLPSPSWMLSPNSPMSRDRKFSFNIPSEEHSPRVVLQELNFGSPTLKKVFDFDIALSSKTSPKRKTFAEPPPWERSQENIYSEDFASPKRKNLGTRDTNL